MRLGSSLLLSGCRNGCSRGCLASPSIRRRSSLLLVLIAVQAARLLWILVDAGRPGRRLAGLGRARRARRRCQPRRASIPSSASRATAGPAVVTSLNLKLYGVREDRATGRGSAIIALPDGRQLSFAVGEEIMPGVALAAVGFDNVTIDRGGARRADLPRPVRAGAGRRGRAGAGRRPPRVSRRRRRRRCRSRRPRPQLRPRRPGRRSASSRAWPAAGSTASSSARAQRRRRGVPRRRLRARRRDRLGQRPARHLDRAGARPIRRRGGRRSMSWSIAAASACRAASEV